MGRDRLWEKEREEKVREITGRSRINEGQHRLSKGSETPCCTYITTSLVGIAPSSRLDLSNISGGNPIGFLRKLGRASGVN